MRKSEMVEFLKIYFLFQIKKIIAIYCGTSTDDLAFLKLSFYPEMQIPRKQISSEVVVGLVVGRVVVVADMGAEVGAGQTVPVI